MARASTYASASARFPLTTAGLNFTSACSKGAARSFITVWESRAVSAPEFRLLALFMGRFLRGEAASARRWLGGVARLSERKAVPPPHYRYSVQMYQYLCLPW